jgi:hypothetical protein
VGGRLAEFGDPSGAENTILVCADGGNWIQVHSGTFGVLKGITYGNGQFVAVGGWVLTSADGVTWTQQSSGGLSAVTFGNGHFVAVGRQIVSSSDGVNWVQQSLGTNQTQYSLTSIAFGIGKFVAVGKSCDSQGCSPAVVYSDDGVNWLQPPLGIDPAHVYLTAVAFGGNQFIAVGNSCDSQGCVAVILTSTDGVNWVQQLSAIQNGLSGITYANGNWVAVGPGVIASSYDGAHWVQRRSSDTLELYGVAYGNGSFVAVGYPGTILQSGGLIVLSVKPSSTAGLLSLSLEGPTGLNYAIQASADLVTWRDVTTITGSPSGKIILEGLAPAGDRVFYRAYSP